MGVVEQMVEVMKGQKTPAAAVEAVKNSINAQMKAYWG